MTWHGRRCPSLPFIQRGYALYFSRAPIPGGHAHAPPAPGASYLLHLGLQCFAAPLLARFPALPPTPLAAAEDLEQLRALEHGHRMRVVTVHAACDEQEEGGRRPAAAHGVDEPADVARVEAVLAERHQRRQRTPQQA